MKSFGWLCLGLTYFHASIEATPKNVVIVGAGPSGIAAAKQLLARGVPNVQIIEARSRLGGRVHTDFNTFAGVPADMGASWIHGIDGNILTSWANEFGLQRVTTDYERSVRFYSNGKKYSKQEYWRSEEKWEAWLEKTETERCKLGETRDGAFSDMLKRTASNVENYHNEDTNFFLSYWLEYDFGTPESMSSQWWDSEDEINGDEQIFPGGYSRLFSYVVSKYKIPIQYNTIVRKIKTNGNNNPITLTFGDSHGTTMTCDALIVTVPLGVLKSGSIEFNPPLPSRMTNAIGRLKMGAVTKVFVQFANDFWTEKVGDAHFILMNPSKADINANARGKWTNCVNGNAVFAKPNNRKNNVLMCVATGDYSKDLDERVAVQGSSIAVEELMARLRIVFPNAPQPTKFTVSRWGVDPLTRGSYSYATYGSEENDFDKLAEPILANFVLAGEHTNQKQRASVHGAVNSGIRAANAILGQPKAPYQRKPKNC